MKKYYDIIIDGGSGSQLVNKEEMFENMDRYAYYIMTIPKKVSHIKNMLLPEEWIKAGMPSHHVLNSEQEAQECDARDGDSSTKAD